MCCTTRLYGFNAIDMRDTTLHTVILSCPVPSCPVLPLAFCYRTVFNFIHTFSGHSRTGVSFSPSLSLPVSQAKDYKFFFINGVNMQPIEAVAVVAGCEKQNLHNCTDINYPHCHWAGHDDNRQNRYKNIQLSQRKGRRRRRQRRVGVIKENLFVLGFYRNAFFSMSPHNNRIN